MQLKLRLKPRPALNEDSGYDQVPAKALAQRESESVGRAAARVPHQYGQHAKAGPALVAHTGNEAARAAQHREKCVLAYACGQDNHRSSNS